MILRETGVITLALMMLLGKGYSMNIKVPGQYPDREYGHCVLGNGIDLLYVDWSGAMTFKDQINGIFGYWYKTDRKQAPRHDPLPLLRVKYCLVSEAGPIEIASSRQSFNPETATLVSQIKGGPFEFTVTTFLTQEHLLVLNFRFKKFPEKGAIYFALDDNRVTYTRKLVDRLSEPVRYSVNNGRILAEFENRTMCPFKGVGVMEVVGDGKIEAFDRVPRPYFGSSHDKNDPITHEALVFPYLTSGVLIRTGNLKPGDQITCYTCLVDNIDDPDYLAKATKIMDSAKSATYKTVKQEHEDFWRAYMKKTEISVTPDINYQYKLSQYLLKAVQYPNGAMIPSSVYPNNHGCLVYWDALFDQMGFLRSNHLNEARKIAEFWLLGLDRAGENARKLGARGAYYGWAVGYDGIDPAASGANQVHYNGDIALSCWLFYEYALDTDYLRKIFPVMKETIDFLISAYVETCPDGIRVKPCETLDESSQERVGDTWTTALIIIGIENIKKAAGLINEPVDTQAYCRVQKGLMASLKKNCDAGVLYSHAGRGDLNAGSVLSMLFLGKYTPENTNWKKTYHAYLSSVIEDAGIGWGHSSRMRCSIFPWAELMTAVFLAQRNDARAAQHIKRAMGATNSFGGFAEYIWAHGLISRQWYVSAHGTFLWAISEMLVSARENDIILFPGIAPEWKNLSFEGLALPGNIRISAVMKQGRISMVSLTNESGQDAVRTIRYGNRKKTVRIPAGQTIRISSLT